MDEYGTFKAYVTKHALTKGVVFTFARQVSKTMIAYGGRCATWDYARAGEWHKTEEEAIARAEEMRKERIASLKKSLKKIQRLNFEIRVTK